MSNTEHDRHEQHKIIDLNVGGEIYTTTLETLKKCKQSKLAQWFSSGSTHLPKDKSGRYTIDRDGPLFRYILDFLRNGRLILPENFAENGRLLQECEYYDLKDLANQLRQTSPDNVILTGRAPSFITIGYQGTLAGKQGLGTDVCFRKINRILVCGKVSNCREVFGETINESRDPDRGDQNRYTGRFFLKHTYLEQAFEALSLSGYQMVCGTSSGATLATNSSLDNVKLPAILDEEKWAKYCEFVFRRC